MSDGALAVLRRGLAASPELRQGMPVTVALALVGAAGRVAVPIVIQQVIDRGITDDGVRLGVVAGLCGFGLLLVLVTMAANLGTQLRLARSSEDALFGLRTRAFRHIHRLSLRHHTAERRGALVSRVTSDVETLSQFFSWGGLAWVVNSAVIVTVAVAMFAYDWRLALVVLTSVVPLIWVLRIVQRRLLAAWDAVRDRVGGVLTAVSEAVAGAAVVRGYGAQRRVADRVSESIEAHRRSVVRAGSLSAFLFPSGEVFAAITTAAVVVIGYALGPAHGLSAGELVAFLFLVTIFLEPVGEFTEVLDQTQTAVAGWRKVLDVLDTPIEIADPPDGLDVAAAPPRIVVDHVSYAYGRGGGGGRDESWALRGVSLDIEPGLRVALVGETGSGKSTLAKLLVRLADPTEGQILVGGIDIRTIKFSSLRSTIVLVPQETFLFDASIADNVRFGMGAPVSDQRVRAAFEELGLDDWLDELPGGLATSVGERGEFLSVGERQLIALVRAAVTRPACLVLDEATSAVDPATESRLTRALDAVSRGRTTITIAHRLATAERADVIYVLGGGELLEHGNHTDLVARGGTYAALHASWIEASATADSTPARP